MVTDQPGDRRRRLVAVALLLVVVPLPLIGGLYVLTDALGISFGNTVFVLSGVVGLGWVPVLGGSPAARMGMAAGDQHDGGLVLNSEGARRANARAALRQFGPVHLLLALTGTVVAGWALMVHAALG